MLRARPELGQKHQKNDTATELQLQVAATGCVIDQHHFDMIFCLNFRVTQQVISGDLLAIFSTDSQSQFQICSMEAGPTSHALALAALTSFGRSALHALHSALQTLRQRALKRDVVGSLKQLSRTEPGDSGLTLHSCLGWYMIDPTSTVQ